LYHLEGELRRAAPGLPQASRKTKRIPHRREAVGLAVRGVAENDGVESGGRGHAVGGSLLGPEYPGGSLLGPGSLGGCRPVVYSSRFG